MTSVIKCNCIKHIIEQNIFMCKRRLSILLGWYLHSEISREAPSIKTKNKGNYTLISSTKQAHSNII
jgi:DNA replication protein DnaD